MKGDRLGEFEELVLLAIHALGADAYGLAVHQLLERETSRRVSLGAVYAALDRIETKGLVRSAMTEGTPVRGGRRRRAYALSGEGLRTLDAIRRVRERLYHAAGLGTRKERA